MNYSEQNGRVLLTMSPEDYRALTNFVELAYEKALREGCSIETLGTFVKLQEVFMSYKEEDGQVVLKMSREDYSGLLVWLGYALGASNEFTEKRPAELLELLNRLNEGNPDFTPYQVKP